MFIKLRRRCFLNICRCLLSLVLLLVLFFTTREIIHYNHLSAVVLDTPIDYTKTLKNTSLAKAKNISLIFEDIRKCNNDQIILNLETYGKVQSDSLILVILVDNDVEYLQLVIESLSNASGIEELLLVFSHSYYDEIINYIIRSINFCRVLQIYYPYSIQLNPYKFPGSHPNDCPFNMNPKQAEQLGCIGAGDPDVNGQYRKPLQAQNKHHWWWTSNFVFEKLSFSPKYNGVVIFLDDDVIFTRDFIYMILYMRFLASSVPNCDLLTFGSKKIADKFEGKDFYTLELGFWSPKNYARVLAFDMTVWNNIASHYNIFCSYDDSSWISSLHYVSLNRIDKNRYKTMSTVAPRAIALRDCNSNNCDVPTNLIRIDKFQQNYTDFWFPSFLELYIDLENLEDDDVVDFIVPGGGWADSRDIELCYNMTVSKIKKIVMEMKHDADAD